MQTKETALNTDSPIVSPAGSRDSSPLIFAPVFKSLGHCYSSPNLIADTISLRATPIHSASPIFFVEKNSFKLITKCYLHISDYESFIGFVATEGLFEDKSEFLNLSLDALTGILNAMVKTKDFRIFEYMSKSENFYNIALSRLLDDEYYFEVKYISMLVADNEERVRKLPQENQKNLVYFAIANHNFYLLVLLLKSINEFKFKDGIKKLSPLHFAIKVSPKVAAPLLLESWNVGKQDLEALDVNGYTVLHYAYGYGIDEKIIRMICKIKPQLVDALSHGRNPLKPIDVRGRFLIGGSSNLNKEFVKEIQSEVANAILEGRNRVNEKEGLSVPNKLAIQKINPKLL